MTNEQLTSAARTVVELGNYLEDLKLEALEIYKPSVVAARGYITPSNELKLRHLQISYWKTRNALFELLYDIWQEVERIDRATPQQFLICLAAAALLVDAARFLRETFHRITVVRRKLDEPDPVYGIPPRMYDDVQKSLTSPYHAWHLWQATRYYDKHHSDLAKAAAAEGIEPLVAIIDRLRDRLRPSLWTYIRTRAHVRGRRAVRHIGRDVLGRVMYSLQAAAGRGLAEIRVRPGHVPSLPRSIRTDVVQLLRPGDVLVVRKEFAASNYFLPGHWPHAALFLGTAGDFASSAISNHLHVQPRLSELFAATHVTAVLVPDLENAWTDGGVEGTLHPCVLEAMKDGVRIRSINSALNSDSVVIVRPLLERSDIESALAQALMHEGKPYDFDFDFCASHRLVCTEVVYRAYEGIAGVQFDLRRHAGRFALAAGDILRMALARRHFEVVAVYVPGKASAIETGDAACDIVQRFEGGGK
jgi:hypothetical protein